MNTSGIDYFPFNANFFEDDKIELMEARHGIAGSYMVFRCFCKSYNLEGYFMRWNTDVCKMMERKVAGEIKASKINEIIESLVELDVFDKGMFEKHHILTSRGIQRRYLDAKKRTQSFEMKGEYLLVPEEAGKYTNLHIVYDVPEPEVSAAAIMEEQATQEPAPQQEVPAVVPEPVAVPAQQPQRQRRGKYAADQRQDASPEQVEDDKLVFVFFFNNFVNPNAEFEKFKRWNDRKYMDKGGWAAIPKVTRQGMAIDWKQDPPGQTRFPKMFLDMWQDAYSELSKHDAPFAVLHDMLRDDIAWADDAVGIGSETRWIYTITCTKAVSDYLTANKVYLPENMRKLIENKTITFKTCS